LKVAVFGHHPDLFPGFNALMTANLAYGFAKAGLTVTVLLPNTPSRRQFDRMTKRGLSIASLDRFGAEFDVRIIESTDNPGDFDLGVWQSYFPEDEAFFPNFRKSVRIVAKNCPRLLTGEPDRDVKRLHGTARRYDIVGLSLKVDKEIADSLAHRIPDAVARSIYMPRGFRADWFLPPSSGSVPVLGLEKGVDSDSSEYAYLVPVIRRLRAEFGRIDVIGARLNDPAITTSTLGLLPARQFYEQFLSPLWAYLMIDVNRSRQSKNVVTVAGRRIYPGMYENQIVEAQLAGAAVVGQAEALPAELVASDRVGLRFDGYDDTDAIFDFLARVIADRAGVSAAARAWGRANHLVDNMVQPLIRAL
jgi:hypothetical protein